MSKKKNDLEELAVIEDAIKHAEEQQTAGNIVAELQENRKGLSRLNDRLKLANARLDVICERIKTLLPRLHAALTITIPPETVQHQNEVFAAFVRMFDATLQKLIEADIKQFNERQQAFLKELERSKKEIVRATDKVSLTPFLATCLLLNLLFLTGHFAIATYLAFYDFSVADFKLITFVFLAIITVSDVIFVAYRIWR
ncbi:MAG: hypothetical protein KHX42_07640 [Prevotella sp.]|nr:hypothetical protein [Prevotella sp.]